MVKNENCFTFQLYTDKIPAQLMLWDVVFQFSNPFTFNFWCIFWTLCKVENG